MFKMAAPIQNSAKCEFSSVIRFRVKGQRPADIHEETVSVYGDMNRQNVAKSCRHFSEKGH